VVRITQRLGSLCGVGLAVSFALWMTGYWPPTFLNVQIGLTVLIFIVMGLEMARILYSGYLQHRQIGPAICACLAAITLCGGVYWLVPVTQNIGTNEMDLLINSMVGVLVASFALLCGAVMWGRRALKTVNSDTALGVSWLFGRKAEPRRLWSLSSNFVWLVVLAVVLAIVQFNFELFESGAFYETAKIAGIGLFLLMAASGLPRQYRSHGHYRPIAISVLGDTALAAVLTMILAPQPIASLFEPSPALSTIGLIFIAGYAAMSLGQVLDRRLAKAFAAEATNLLPAEAR
jgi:hypothetical protein